MQFVFNGSIEQIYQQTSTAMYNSYQQFISARDKQAKYDKLIAQISEICYPKEEQIKSCQRYLYNFSANFKNKIDAIEAMEKMGEQQFGDKMPFIQPKIMNYKNTVQIPERFKRQNSSIKSEEAGVSIEDKTSGFDQRSDIEVKIAEQIRLKNQAIAQQKINQKQSEKPKILAKTNPNSPANN